MRHYYLLLLVAVSLAACDQPKQHTDLSKNAEQAEQVAETTEVDQKSETDKLNEWFEVKYEEELMRSPLGLTFIGRKERYGEIDDLSVEAQDEQLALKRASVEEMENSFDYDKLSDDAKLSYDLWKYQFEQMERAAQFRGNKYIFEQMQGTHAFFPTLLMNFHRVETAEDMQAFNSRVSGVGRAINQLIEQAKDGAKNGVRPPRFAYEIVIKQAKDIISGKPFDDSDKDSSLFENAKQKLAGLVKSEKLTQEESDKLLEQTKTALVNDFKPAYQSLIAFLESDFDNTDAESKGVSALPNGEAYYSQRLANMTTTNMTAEEIHQLGLTEVERIRGLMEQVKEKAGFKGSLQEYFAYIRDDKDNREFYYPNTDEGRLGYIADATAAIEAIKKELPNYFGVLPKADLVVKRVESFREQDGAAQHYYPGTPDGSRPGTYYAHLSDMTAMPKNELEVIAYHEGLPGHHMQLSIAQEAKGVPTFRTQANFTAYAEGWALYSEILAKEMPNTYATLNSEFGRLGSEMWRAIRLVVDTGLHAKGWSEQQAVDYFKANSPAPEETIRSEIRRYLVMPGQATSYKVGMIHIQKLRAKAEKELGDKFDIRGFHDTVLAGGALPLTMLTKQVNRWIEKSKKPV